MDSIQGVFKHSVIMRPVVVFPERILRRNATAEAN